MTEFEHDERAGAHGAAVRALAEAATAADGVAPFNDDAMLRLDERALVGMRAEDGSLAAAALTHPIDGALEAELAVHPGHRRNGLGRALIDELRGRVPGGGELVTWAHGNLDSARALAASAGMRETRVLYKLGRAVAESDGHPVAARDDVTIGAFRPGVDDADFLALNAQVFRDHPEQGALDQAGLDARTAQDWFVADAFLLARDTDTGALLGYNWLKLATGTDDAGGEGEIYVIGVADEAAGRGLGRALMTAGLARIHASGLPRTTLYVEGDNERALGLYRSLGYEDDAVDVQYRG